MITCFDVFNDAVSRYDCREGWIIGWLVNGEDRIVRLQAVVWTRGLPNKKQEF
jgi:hypothetical protein